MQRVTALTLATLFSLMAAAQANPVVWFGQQVYLTGRGQTLDVAMYVANDPSTNDFQYTSVGGLMGLDLYVQLGDGGTAQDGSDPGPQFISGPAPPGLG